MTEEEVNFDLTAKKKKKKKKTPIDLDGAEQAEVCNARKRTRIKYNFYFTE